MRSAMSVLAVDQLIVGYTRPRSYFYRLGAGNLNHGLWCWHGLSKMGVHTPSMSE